MNNDEANKPERLTEEEDIFNPVSVNGIEIEASQANHFNSVSSMKKIEPE